MLYKHQLLCIIYCIFTVHISYKQPKVNLDEKLMNLKDPSVYTRFVLFACSHHINYCIVTVFMRIMQMRLQHGKV
jgi:ribosomal protein S26